jgi:hypothetical protein
LNRKWDKEKILKRSREFSVTRSAERLVDIYESLKYRKNNKKLIKR